MADDGKRHYQPMTAGELIVELARLDPDELVQAEFWTCARNGAAYIKAAPIGKATGGVLGVVVRSGFDDFSIGAMHATATYSAHTSPRSPVWHEKRGEADG